MRLAYVATVHILIDANGDGEAADAFSAFLTETGIYDNIIKDWSYPLKDGRYVYPQPIQIEDDYDRDSVDLACIVPAKLKLG